VIHRYHNTHFYPQWCTGIITLTSILNHIIPLIIILDVVEQSALVLSSFIGPLHQPWMVDNDVEQSVE
jgi:hypothetical protein